MYVKHKKLAGVCVIANGRMHAASERARNKEESAQRASGPSMALLRSSAASCVTLLQHRLLCTSTPVPRLFGGAPPTQKQRRVAATVKEALTSTLASGLIKDRGFRNGEAVHVVDVQVARGCSLARVLWEPLMDDDQDDNAPKRISAALERKSGILRAHVNSYVNQKVAIKLEFVHARPVSHAATQAARAQAERAAQFELVQADLDATARRRRAIAAEANSEEHQQHADQGSPSEHT